MREEAVKQKAAAFQDVPEEKKAEALCLEAVKKDDVLIKIAAVRWEWSSVRQQLPVNL